MHRFSPLAAVAVLVAVAATGLLPAGPGAASAKAREPLRARVSLAPDIAVTGATPHREARLAEAVAKYTGIGLRLPDLEVVFSADPQDCLGHPGLFEASRHPWRISICSSLDFVYEHELAHAWEHANVSDDVRAAFMAQRGVARWNDPGDAWEERGVEQAAFVIQQNLLGRRLPSVSAEWRSRMVAFEVLTGLTSPMAP